MSEVGTGGVASSVQGLWARMNPTAPRHIVGQVVGTPRGLGIMSRCSSRSSSGKPRQQRAASADGNLSAQYALEAKDAELGLLRARFNLRLDAERVATEDASSSLREVCEEATRLQQKAAVAELAAMRRGFAETTSL